MTRDFLNNPWAASPQDENPWAEAVQPPEEAIQTNTLGRLEALDFQTAIQRNRRNTWFLMLGMLVLAGGFGYLLGWGWDAAVRGSMPTSMHSYDTSRDWLILLKTPSPLGIKIGLSLLCGMLVWAWIALWRADRMVLRMADAREIPLGELPQLHNLVEEMALASGLPKPRVFLMATDVPNAFATGLRSDKAAIGITQGLLDRLSRRELQGVIAHEMGHVLNGDMRYATLLAVMTGVLVFVAQIVLNMRHLVGYGGMSAHGERGERRTNPVMLIIFVAIAILAAIVVPILARLIQMAVSRQREYLADATAVRLTRDPRGMINALQKIADFQSVDRGLPQALEPLYIISPAQMLQNGNMAWFSTHPPLNKRIERLKLLE